MLAIITLLATFASTATSCTPSPSITYAPICPGPPLIWEARPSPGKGIGVYATRVINPGDIILSEPPIIHFTPPEFRDGVAYPLGDIRTILQSSFDALPPERKDEVLSLHAHMTPSDSPEDRLMAIMRSNAYTTNNSLGLFPKGARINHSCRPNSSQYWDASLNRRIVHANRRIEAGEEIFATYIPLLYPHAARQTRLDQFGFKCSCEACALGAEDRAASDARRSDLARAFSAFETQLSLRVPRSAAGLRKARKNAAASVQLVALVEQEGLADYYVKAYHVAAVCHGRVEAWREAAVWANRGYEASLLGESEARERKELEGLTSLFIYNWNEALRRGAGE